MSPLSRHRRRPDRPPWNRWTAPALQFLPIPPPSTFASLFRACALLNLAASISDEQWTPTGSRAGRAPGRRCAQSHAYPGHRTIAPHRRVWATHAICGFAYGAGVPGVAWLAHAYWLRLHPWAPMSGGPLFTAIWARTNRHLFLPKALLDKTSRYRVSNIRILWW
jgi:hypothetical protein